MGGVKPAPRRPGSTSEGTEAEAEDAVLIALEDRGTEANDLYERIKRLARSERGYLRKRLAEDNPVTAARRRLEGEVKEMKITKLCAASLVLIRKQG